MMLCRLWLPGRDTGSGGRRLRIAEKQQCIHSSFTLNSVPSTISLQRSTDLHISQTSNICGLSRATITDNATVRLSKVVRSVAMETAKQADNPDTQVTIGEIVLHTEILSNETHSG